MNHKKYKQAQANDCPLYSHSLFTTIVARGVCAPHLTEKFTPDFSKMNDNQLYDCHLANRVIQVAISYQQLNHTVVLLDCHPGKKKKISLIEYANYIISNYYVLVSILCDRILTLIWVSFKQDPNVRVTWNNLKSVIKDSEISNLTKNKILTTQSRFYSYLKDHHSIRNTIVHTNNVEDHDLLEIELWQLVGDECYLEFYNRLLQGKDTEQKNRIMKIVGTPEDFLRKKQLENTKSLKKYIIKKRAEFAVMNDNIGKLMIEQFDNIHLCCNELLSFKDK